MPVPPSTVRYWNVVLEPEAVLWVTVKNTVLPSVARGVGVVWMVNVGCWTLLSVIRMVSCPHCPAAGATAGCENPGGFVDDPQAAVLALVATAPPVGLS